MGQYRIELSSPEIVLLRRALAIYARFYQDLRAKSARQWEKDELKTMERAAENLSYRLKTDIAPAETASQAVLDRIMKELTEYGGSHFAEDEEGWEAATQALVLSLTKGVRT